MSNMKLIMESWRKFLLREQQDFKVLSVEEYDNLSKEQQLEYLKSIKFGNMKNASGNKFAKVFSGGYITLKPDGLSNLARTKHKFTRQEYEEVRRPRLKGPKGEVQVALGFRKPLPGQSKIPSWLPWLKKILAGSDPKNIDATGTLIKKEWKKHADMSFFNQWVWVHGFQKPEYLRAFIEGNVVEPEDEVSVIGYPKSGVVDRTWGDVGIIVEGDLVYAFGGGGQTDNFAGKKRGEGVKDVKFTGKPELLITNQENFSHYGRESMHEAIIDNWSIKGFVMTEYSWNSLPDVYKQLIIKFSDRYPVYDKDFKEIKV